MRYASRRVSGGVQSIRCHGADLVAVTVGKQPIKLRAIALKFSPIVEDLAEGLLYHGNAIADAQFAAQLLLNIGGR